MMRTQTRRSIGALAALTFLGACDAPTTFPEWDTTIRLPSATGEVSVAEFLPAGVESDGTHFLVADDTVTTRFAVSEIVDVSSPYLPDSITYPAFTFGDTLEAQFPGSIVSVELAGGRLEIDFYNGFPYSLLANSDSTGFVSILARDVDGTIIARDSVDGSANEWKSLTTLSLALDLAGRTLTRAPVIEFQLKSPGSGTKKPLWRDAEVRVTARTTKLAASSATVSIPQSDFSGSTNIQIDAETRDRIERTAKGAVLDLWLTSPFSLTGNFRVDAGDPTLGGATTGGDLLQGENHYQLRLDDAQIRALLLDPAGLRFAYSGTMSAGQLTVRPADKITYRTRMESTLVVNAKN